MASFLRLDDREIRQMTNIYNPDCILCMDPTVARGPTPLRIRAILTQPALQSAERRGNMFSAQFSAALNRRQTAASGQARPDV